MPTDPTSTDDQELPVPLLERGDVVRFKEPYNLGKIGTLPRVIDQSARAIGAWKTDNETLADAIWDSKLVGSREIQERDDAPNVREFTHGIIAEIVSRYPAHEVELSEGRMVYFDDQGGGPPRVVSLFLFNANTGLVFLNRGGDTAVPWFVDQNVRKLVLVEKHDTSYEPLGIDIEAVYDEWGIVDPARELMQDLMEEESEDNASEDSG